MAKRRWRRDLLTRLRRQGFAARVAVADTPGAAWAVARYGAAGHRAEEVRPRRRCCRCRSRRCASMPTRSLDLKTSGLVRIQDIACRPRAPFAARFGKDPLLRLDQALGRAEESIRPRLPVPVAMAEQRFAEPIAREEDVLGTVEYLARQLATVLERRGEGGRLFQLALFRADGKVHRLELGTGAPLREPARVRRLFEERLAVLGDACDPGFGYDMVRLSALVAERCDPVQSGLASADHGEEIGASDRPARRALRPAPHHPAGAAGHAYSGIRGGRGAGARAGVVRTPKASAGRLAAGFSLAHAPGQAVRMAGAHRGGGAGAGRPAGSLRLAACHASRREGGGPRAHRAGVVARRPRQQADARITSGSRAVTACARWLYREGALWRGQRRPAWRDDEPLKTPEWFLHGLFA